MQATLKTLAAALVAGTVAFGAVAQDKAEKAPAKKAAAEKSTGGKLVVNGVTIPQSRIDMMNKELTASGQPNTPDRQKAVKEELINREVLVQAAQKRGLDKNADVAAQVEMARQAVLVRALFESEVKARPITDADLQKQYEDFKKSMGENEYKVRHILVDKEDDAKAIIAELGKGGISRSRGTSRRTRLQDNGGDLDWGPTARYVKPFADAVLAMKKGQTSTTPVKTDFGYHVIRLDDVRPLKVPGFDEVKEQFRQRAQQQQIQKLVMELRSKAKVEER
jgi:peptidyl-prolyl cis-trans isomerase C